MNKIAASELGKTAISGAKTEGNELTTSAISTAKDIAVEKGKRFLEKSRKKILPSAAIVPVSSFQDPSVVPSASATKPAKRAKKEKGITVFNNYGKPSAQFATNSTTSASATTRTTDTERIKNQQLNEG